MHVTNRYKSYKAEFWSNLFGAAVGVVFLSAPWVLPALGVVKG